MSRFCKEITLLDAAFAVTGDPIKVFESLLYTDAWEKHGSIALVVGVDRLADLRAAAWVQVDGRVYEVETILSEDDELTVKVTGASLNVLLDRVVTTAAGRLDGQLEAQARALVTTYAMTGGQAVAQLVLGTEHEYDCVVDIEVERGKTLSEVLYAALNQRGYSYEITLASNGDLVFDILQGLDRSQDQSTNAPVSMSTRGAIEKAAYKRTIYDYRNYAIVCDEDEDSPTTVIVDQSDGAPVRAMYVSASGKETTDLEQIGIDALAEAAAVETLDGDVNSELAPIYKTDYNIGDVLDVIDTTREIILAKRVLTVEHLIDKNTDFSITPKFGKDFLTLRQLIQKELRK